MEIYNTGHLGKVSIQNKRLPRKEEFDLGLSVGEN